MGPSREPLLKGKAQYSSPPCTSSAPFDNTNIIHFFTKQATLLRRSIVLSLPLQLVFPGPRYVLQLKLSEKNDFKNITITEAREKISTNLESLEH